MVKRRNPTRAEREAMASFEALKRKWDNVPKFARGSAPKVVASSGVPALTTPPGRSSGHEYKSLDTGHAGGTKPIHGLRYTGDKLIGIGVLHKSNSVPVFKGEDAIDIARMRRG